MLENTEQDCRALLTVLNDCCENRPNISIDENTNKIRIRCSECKREIFEISPTVAMIKWNKFFK